MLGHRDAEDSTRKCYESKFHELVVRCSQSILKQRCCTCSGRDWIDRIRASIHESWRPGLPISRFGYPSLDKARLFNGQPVLLLHCTSSQFSCSSPHCHSGPLWKAEIFCDRDKKRGILLPLDTPEIMRLCKPSKTPNVKHNIPTEGVGDGRV